MEDDTRMIESARRKAKRMAKASGASLQQEQDRLAQQLGRKHWAAYKADPVEVPRDVHVPTDASTAYVIRPPVDPEALGQWDALETMRLENGDSPAPRHKHNVLGKDSLPGGERERGEYIRAVAGQIVPAYDDADFFGENARCLLTAMMEIEISRADEDGDDPSMGRLARWVRNECHEATRHGGETNRNALVEWLMDLRHEAEERGLYGALGNILPMGTMGHREVLSIMGAVDRALRPYHGSQQAV